MKIEDFYTNVAKECNIEEVRRDFSQGKALIRFGGFQKHYNSSMFQIIAAVDSNTTEIIGLSVMGFDLDGIADEVRKTHYFFGFYCNVGMIKNSAIPEYLTLIPKLW